MKSLVIFLLKKIQILLLNITYILFYVVNKNKIKNNSWVIGVDEIASNIYFLGNILKNSTTVCFNKNMFYSLKYNYSILDCKNKYLNFIFRTFYGPILLGYLASKNNNFFYIWHTGFTLDREMDFKFLKDKNKKIVCMYVGEDIRSYKLMINHMKSIDMDFCLEYMGSILKQYLTEEYDIEKRKVAKITDMYVDVVFNSPFDQMSYIKSKQYFQPYMYDKNKFFKNDNKFLNLKTIKILHAPSSPIFKGTPLVRAAIKKLKIEGYLFEYIELQNMTNEEVLNNLKNSHILLNQFYHFVPGLLGIEGMANHCAVLMSADPAIETGLPQNIKDTWMITKYWEVYDNLKYLLDNPDKIKYYADRGYEFAYKHYTYEAAGEYINTVLKENGVIV